jgi:formylglycine-generating enzyme required for sulfatase activity
VLNDDGVRRLAVAVLTQAVADLQGPIPEYRRSAAAFMARRVLRGGSFGSSANNRRAASRDWNYPVNRNLNVGFRVVSSRLRP